MFTSRHYVLAAKIGTSLACTGGAIEDTAGERSTIAAAIFANDCAQALCPDLLACLGVDKVL